MQQKQRRRRPPHGLQNTQEPRHLIAFRGKLGLYRALPGRGAAQPVAHGDQPVLIGAHRLGQRGDLVAPATGLCQHLRRSLQPRGGGQRGRSAVILRLHRPGAEH